LQSLIATKDGLCEGMSSSFHQDQDNGSLANTVRNSN